MLNRKEILSILADVNVESNSSVARAAGIVGNMLFGIGGSVFELVDSLNSEGEYESEVFTKNVGEYTPLSAALHIGFDRWSDNIDMLIFVPVNKWNEQTYFEVIKADGTATRIQDKDHMSFDAVCTYMMWANPIQVCDTDNLPDVSSDLDCCPYEEDEEDKHHFLKCVEGDAPDFYVIGARDNTRRKVDLTDRDVNFISLLRDTFPEVMQDVPMLEHD